MATVEVTALDVLVLKKLVLINAALAKALTDPRAAREQLAMTKEVNDFVLRADLAVRADSSSMKETKP
jgi:hypothetical protein